MFLLHSERESAASTGGTKAKCMASRLSFMFLSRPLLGLGTLRCSLYHLRQDHHKWFAG